MLGSGNCTFDDEYCNGPLREGTQYVFFVRGYTGRAYRDTFPVSFTTRKYIFGKHGDVEGRSTDACNVVPSETVTLLQLKG